MKKLKQKTSINPIFFTIFICFKQVLCLDPNYNLCLPKNCSDGVNISYPFIIKGVHDPICGYPGFEVHCNSNGSAVFNMSQNEYKVMDIASAKNKVRLQNTAVLTKSSQSCENLDIRNFTTDWRFSIDNYTTQNLVLMSKCSSSGLDPGMDIYRVGLTGSCEKDAIQYAMLKNDTNMRNMTGRCGVVVEAPVEVGGGEGWRVNGTNYGEVMERGFELTWQAIDCNECAKSGGRCGFNETISRFVCFCTDGPHRVSCESRPPLPPSQAQPQDRQENRGAVLNWNLKLVIIGFSSAIAGIMLIFFMRYLCKTKRSREVSKAANHQIEVFIRNNGNLALKRFKYSKIKKITNSFHEKLGQGGYGSVYKRNLPSGQLVAVKLLSEATEDGNDFINEVASISRTSHVNVVTLLGFCIEGKKRALMYEFMPNGSLDKFLHSDRSPLDWNTLFLIAKGIARGLEYLHRGCNTRIVHFDIKPHNVLLDEEFVPKISDFGLAKLCKRKESIVSVTGARGTAGYMAPEVFFKSFGGASHKSDVYSFGMMVLEMTGARNNKNASLTSTSEAYFPEWIYKQVEAGDSLGVDGVTTEEEEELARKLVTVSLWCIQSAPSDRPSISRVLEMLEGDSEWLQVPPKRFWSSPASLAQGTFSSATESLSNDRVSIMH